MAILRTIDQVAVWCEGAARQFRDPSVPVGLCFARWTENVATYRGDDVVLGPAKSGDEVLALKLGPAAAIPLAIQYRQPFYNMAGELEIFGADEITDGVWSLTPSLNIPGLIHCFVVLYGVPETANWLRSAVVRVR